MPRIRFLLFFVLVIFLCMGCSAVSANSGSDTTYMINCRMIDGTGAPPVDNAVIAIRGSVIAEAETKDSITVAEGAKIIDLKGATVMPGFINAHVHHAYNEQNLENMKKERL
jgi:imidazolonepropionase-like amidohydrolase